jgi:hypothetical protein
MSYTLIFNDQFGLSTLKVQIDIPFIQYKILFTMFLSICTHFYQLRDIKQTKFLFWPFQRIFYFCGKTWVFNTNARKKGLQMINKVIYSVHQKSAREISFP